MTIVEKTDTMIRAKVTKPGVISSRKGVSFPDTHIITEFPTKRDLISIEVANELKLPMLMLSFVQTADDVKAVRKLMKHDCKLISKIEMPTAVKNIDAIVAESDIIMIARGDMAVEGGMPNLPRNQKTIVKAA